MIEGQSGIGRLQALGCPQMMEGQPLVGLVHFVVFYCESFLADPSNLLLAQVIIHYKRSKFESFQILN